MKSLSRESSSRNILSKHNNSSRYERIRVIGRVSEVELLSKLDHPHIVGYYDSFEEDGTLMIEMEYADGGTLNQLLERRTKPLNEPELLDLFEQAISAVSYLHENSVIHRDLKTANIFLTKENMVKIGDFGVSKRMSAETKRLGAKTILGTPYYLSPEICQGLPYNEKSDVWAMGCCLYEMATLQKPFDASNFAALINRIINSEYEPIKGNYSDGVKVLVCDILLSDPEKRPCAKEALYRVRTIQKNLSSPGKVSRLFRTFGATSVSLNQSLDESMENGHGPAKVAKKKCQSALYSFDLKSVTVHQIGGIPPKAKVLQIAASEKFFMMLTDAGEVLSWGDDRKTPRKVNALIGKDVSKIALGRTFSVFCADRGIVLNCGNRKFVGNGSFSEDFLKPKIVDVLLSEHAIDVACGDEHTVVLCESGALYVWGNGEYGRLGTGVESFVSSPYKLEIPSYQLVCNVVCGPDCTVLLTRSGTLLATGSNRNNKLNLNAREGFFASSAICTKITKVLVPTALKPFASRVIRVSLGKNHSGVILENGTVHLFGGNSHGELGLGHCQPANFCAPFRSVKALANKVCLQLSCGDGFTMVGTSENELYFWGSKGVFVPLIKTDQEDWSIVNGQWTRVNAEECEGKREQMPVKQNENVSSPAISKNRRKSENGSKQQQHSECIYPSSSFDDEIVVLQPKLILKLDVAGAELRSGVEISPPGTASTRVGTPTSPPPKTASWSIPSPEIPSISLGALVSTGSMVIAIVNYSQGAPSSEKKPQSPVATSSPKERNKKTPLEQKKSSSPKTKEKISGGQTKASRRLSAPDVATWVLQEFESAEIIPMIAGRTHKENGCELEMKLKEELETLRKVLRNQNLYQKNSEKRIQEIQRKLEELHTVEKSSSKSSLRRCMSNQPEHDEPPPFYSSISPTMRIDDLQRHGEKGHQHKQHSPPLVNPFLGPEKESPRSEPSPESTTTTLGTESEGGCAKATSQTKICVLM